ncbi:hypothetical protein IIA79_00420 [bacterium]|nr:hypothetical protein [bacterium]
MREGWPTAFIFAVLAAIMLFVFAVCVEWEAVSVNGKHNEVPASGLRIPLTLTDPVAEFWARVEKYQPKYITLTRNCLVDGVEFEIQLKESRESDNRFGGVATDLMKIALAPPREGIGPPRLDLQEWENILGSCPACGATYTDADLSYIRRGAVPSALSNLRSWDLEAIAPTLAARPVEDWTPDERILVRYLTRRHAGFETVELGFAALSGAYASNLAIALGKKHTIPAPAFYALAAAEFASALDEQDSLNSEAAALTAQILGEMYRLLGRAADAQGAFDVSHEYFEEARLELEEKFASADLDGRSSATWERKLKSLDLTMGILGQLEASLAAGEYHLQRARVKEIEVPEEVGWYLDGMLPSINGELVFHRDGWNGEDDAEAIVSRIAGLFP